MLLLYTQTKQARLDGKTTLPILMFLVLVYGRISIKQRNITSKVEKRTYVETMSNGRRKARLD